jgi:predicted CDP-diglyceride synthetase/phosphatidate cytidylyltransferase
MGYTLAGIVGGGIAPAIFAILLREFKTPFSIALYAAGALMITGIVLCFPVRAPMPLIPSPKE